MLHPDVAGELWIRQAGVCYTCDRPERGGPRLDYLEVVITERSVQKKSCWFENNAGARDILNVVCAWNKNFPQLMLYVPYAFYVDVLDP